MIGNDLDIVPPGIRSVACLIASENFNMDELAGRAKNHRFLIARNDRFIYVQDSILSELTKFVLDLIREQKEVWSAAVTIVEIIDRFDQNLASDLALLADRGQVVMDLAAVELLRTTNAINLQFDDLGTFRMAGDRPSRLFRVRGDDNSTATRKTYSGWYPVSSFGRDREIREIMALMDSSRLVTIFGTPGIGKSHLLRLVVSELSDQLGDLIYWVNVREVAQPDLIWSSIFRVIAPSTSNELLHADAVIRAIGDDAAVIVLDGAEAHLNAIRPIVERLRAECRQLHIFVGSQRKLSLPDEQCYRISGISYLVPNGDEDISNVDAVRMFADRAQLVERNFVVDSENAVTIQAICARLDGNPLAIELAAAKISVFNPRQLLDRLEDRLSLLSHKGPSGNKGRLRETIQWGFQQLSPEAQRLLSQLSMFHGAFSIEAAEAICGESHSIVEPFEELADGAWLSVTHLQVPEKMFFLPETLRMFAREKVESAEQQFDLELRHRKWIFDTVKSNADRLAGVDQADGYERLTAYYGDLLYVIRSGMKKGGDYPLSVDTTIRCARFWFLRGDLYDIRKLIDALIQFRAAKQNPQYARLLNLAAILAHSANEFRVSARLAVQSMSVCKVNKDLQGMARAMNTVGACARDLNLATAAHFHLRAAKIGREISDKGVEFSSLSNFIGALKGRRIWTSIEGPLARGEVLYAATKDIWSKAIWDVNVATMHLLRGELSQVTVRATRAVRALLPLEDYVNVDLALLTLAMSFADQNPPLSARFLGMARQAQRLCKPNEGEYLEPQRSTIESELTKTLGETEMRGYVMEGEMTDFLEGLATWIG